MNMSFKTRYPCPDCDRNLYFHEGFASYFDCVCGYIRFNGNMNADKKIKAQKQKVDP